MNTFFEFGKIMRIRLDPEGWIMCMCNEAMTLNVSNIKFFQNMESEQPEVSVTRFNTRAFQGKP